MRKFDGLDIELTRGDTLSFRVTFKGRALPDNAIALFTVKKRPKDEEPAVVEKRLAITGNKSMVLLTSEDTEGIKPRMYYWDIRVVVPEGDGTYWVSTPMESAAFMVTSVVGDVSSAAPPSGEPSPPDTPGIPDEPDVPDIPDEPDEPDPPPVVVILTVDQDGNATLDGAAVTVAADGAAVLENAVLTVDENGNGIIK